MGAHIIVRAAQQHALLLLLYVGTAHAIQVKLRAYVLLTAADTAETALAVQLNHLQPALLTAEALQLDRPADLLLALLAITALIQLKHGAALMEQLCAMMAVV